MSICNECTKNWFLSDRISTFGEEGVCVVCGEEKPHVFTLDMLADVFRIAIQEHFTTGATRFEPNESDRNEEVPYGDTLETVVSELLQQDVEFFDDLVDAIVEGEDYRPQDGEEAFFDSTMLYTPISRSETIDVRLRWAVLCDELRHKRRFFSHEVLSFFDELFKGIDRLKVSEQDVFQPEVGVIQEMEQGAVVYRARTIESHEVYNVLSAPLEKIGPPPKNKARSGRMSPEGVVALYCAMDKETALAEIRPAIGEQAAVIELSFTKKLRFLNFERLERSYGQGWGEFLDLDFTENDKIRKFRRKLHNLISRPVVPGNESDYLITQAMAEYLAHIHPSKIDGIMFKSVQRAGGVNLVLFVERESKTALKNQFPVDYVPNSLTFHRTKEVAYKQVELMIPTSPKEGIMLFEKGSLSQNDVD